MMLFYECLFRIGTVLNAWYILIWSSLPINPFWRGDWGSGVLTNISKVTEPGSDRDGSHPPGVGLQSPLWLGPFDKSSSLDSQVKCVKTYTNQNDKISFPMDPGIIYVSWQNLTSDMWPPPFHAVSHKLGLQRPQATLTSGSLRSSHQEPSLQSTPHCCLFPATPRASRPLSTGHTIHSIWNPSYSIPCHCSPPFLFRPNPKDASAVKTWAITLVRVTMLPSSPP